MLLIYMSGLDDPSALLSFTSMFCCRFVVRQGSPLQRIDLEKAATATARAIVILCDDECASERADSQVLRTVLAVTTILDDHKENKAHIVAEIRDNDSDSLMKLVGGDRIETVVSHDIVGRLMVMSVRQPGLAKVYEQILGFDGDEFYVKEWPEAVGMPFAWLGEHFPDAIVIGIKTVDGVCVLKPHMERRMQDSEEIIFIAEDDDTYDFVRTAKMQVPPGPTVHKGEREAEKMLVCGWRRDMHDIIQLVDDLAEKGSEIHIFSDLSVDEREESLLENSMVPEDLINVKLVHHEGTGKRHFQYLPAYQYTSCLIVADEMRETDAVSADNRTITALLMVRNVQMLLLGLDEDEERFYNLSLSL